MYLILAVVMGLVQRKWDPPLWLMTILFVPATLRAVWLGTRISTVLLFSQTTWAVIIMAYCFVASVLPIWTLLQPRGYLGGFVLATSPSRSASSASSSVGSTSGSPS